ncbi:alpha-tocopherol transfer protein-like [Diorhabda sublineata]|uniref:alpha-tocopherol transfer protein-like n=1 Tax=Diorhabda sublineata TaxID=1163346 RepID=UPI0024E11522|nr:alpha-tocopherol transfer protein-like [Diorhabda sublineata]
MSVQQLDLEEMYKKIPELKRNEVKILKNWVEKQPYLPNISEFQVALFLHSCYYKQEAAKAAIDVYYTVRTLCPDIFQCRTCNDPGIQVVLDHSVIAATPLPNGDTMIIGRCGEAEYFTFVNQLKVFDALLQLNLRKNGPLPGLHIVVDLKNITFTHFIKLSSSVLILKKFFYLLQEGLPVRIKYLHFVNLVSFIDKILSLGKPFLKNELIKCVKIHQKFDSIYEYIPREAFPIDYGGSAESFEKLRQNTASLIKANEKFLNSEDLQRVDESKRSGIPKSINEIFGVEGSFKKLEFD